MFAKNGAPVVLDDKYKGELVVYGKKYRAESMEADFGEHRTFVWFARRRLLLPPDRFKIDLSDLLFDEKSRTYKQTAALTIKGKILGDGQSHTSSVETHTAQDFAVDGYRPLGWYFTPQTRLEDFRTPAFC